MGEMEPIWGEIAEQILKKNYIFDGGVDEYEEVISISELPMPDVNDAILRWQMRIIDNTCDRSKKGRRDTQQWKTSFQLRDYKTKKEFLKKLDDRLGLIAFEVYREAKILKDQRAVIVNFVIRTGKLVFSKKKMAGEFILTLKFVPASRKARK